MNRPAHNTNVTLIAEGRDYVVVNKPAPLKIHPNAPDGNPTLWGELCGLLAYEIANGGQVSIVNRLDRETSGVVLVATTAEAARRFGFAMMEHRFRKIYEVLVFGWPEWDDFDLDAPLRREGELRPSPVWVQQCVHESGSPSRTRFHVLQRIQHANGAKYARIEAQPVTGRMHQIRTHLKHLGLPVVGDKLYGPDPAHYLEFIETGWTPRLAERLVLPRQALHSKYLELQGEGRWHAPLPVEFTALIEGVSATCPDADFATPADSKIAPRQILQS
jgi:23S rRNA pseudouridine1911/1915/1917 synthase